MSVSGSNMRVNAYSAVLGVGTPQLFLANDLIITGTNDWHDATASLQNFKVSESMEIWVRISGSNTVPPVTVGSEYTAIQIDFSKP